MTVPNVLTAIRVLFVPVFAWLYVDGRPIPALMVYLFCALTDALDGYLARRLNQVTDFGKLVDPLADKLMLLTILFCLTWSGHVHWWIPAALLLRECYQVVGSAYLLKRKNVVVYARLPGKISTCLFILGIVMVYPWHEWTLLTLAGQWLLVAALVFALVSSVCYTCSFGIKGQSAG